jgi:WS/DGAT/MGAT family acyltransferase
VVERLTGADASYLYMETPTLHMHTLKIALVDASSVPGGYTFGLLQDELAARLHLLPPFRRRLVQVPFQINHPVWVEDHDFDQSLHVRRHTIPAPGGMRELEELIGEIASTQLDRSKPLWEIHVCEGLADGRVAVVTKMHHALADGNAANALLANIMDILPATVPELPHTPWQGEPTPSRGDLLRDGVRDWFLQLLTLPALLLKTVRAVVAVARPKKGAQIAVPRPILDTPRTSFNGAITARRSFSTATIPIAEFKKVRQAHGVTLNDVVLAVAGGALLRWLAARGETVEGSLTAGVPMRTDSAEIVRLGGNAVTNLFTSLHTDIADPVERLHAISRTTAESKKIGHTLGLDMLESWWQFTPPGPFSFFTRTYSRLKAANLHAAPFNLVVSNVPGPPLTVHIGGARLDELFSVGPILEGIGLNLTVWSYEGRMSFSAIACPDTFPDLPRFTAALSDALEELIAAS